MHRARTIIVLGAICRQRSEIRDTQNLATLTTCSFFSNVNFDRNVRSINRLRLVLFLTWVPQQRHKKNR